MARPDIRERLIAAAYELLVRRGAAGTGVDLIAGRADCAKATLYKLFGSKAELMRAALQRREELWTQNWLEEGIMSRSNDAEGRLIAIFDMFHEWFRRDDFEGCTFMKVLLDPTIDPTIRTAALRHTDNIRALVVDLADGAGLPDAEGFADAWLTIMHGAIAAAMAGNPDAALIAKRAAEPLLRAWPRRRRRV